jgi:hypothetical protein
MNTWVDTQNKMVSNWKEAVEKMQGLPKDASMLKGSMEIYKNWYEAQRELLSKSMEKSANIAIPADMMPAQMKEMLEKQRNYTQAWVNAMNQMAQEQMDTMLAVADNPQAATEKWIAYYKNWFSKVTDLMGDMKMGLPGDSAKEAFENMTSAYKSYFNAYELWQPFVKMMSDKNYDWRSYFKAVDFEKFQKQSQEMFAMISPAKFHQMSEQVSKFIEDYRKALLDSPMVAPYRDILAKYTELFPMMSGLQNSMKFGAMQEEMMGKLQKMYAPFYKIIPPSREKEMAQIVVDMQSDLMKYQTKVAEMNYMIGNSVRQASEKLMRDLFERAKEGEMVVKSYNEFFLTWLNVLEEQMIELFKSDEFSKIQGEVLSLQLDLKTAVNKGVEYLLSPYPVVMHSQIDDLTKQVHALKSKIRALEKQLSDQNAQAEAVTEDAAIEVEVSEDEKKTSSRRKSVK